MVVKKASKKSVKKETKSKKSVKKEEDSEGGLGLDDAFGDDDGVEYAESKPRKEKKKKVDEEEDEILEDDLDEQMDKIERNHGELSIEQPAYQFKASKPIAQVKKGDKVKVDGVDYEVDAHYCLMDHKTTKEMALEIFNPKTDKDYQIRYFDDQVESTMELYELQEILYVKRVFSKIEW